MLKSLAPSLRCPVCLTQETRLDLRVFNDGTDGHVRDGILSCPSCRSWYPIEDELLELVRPALLYEKDYAAFLQKFAAPLQDAGAMPPPGAREDDISAQTVQRRHFDWYAGNEAQTYNAYQQSPFWVAFDAATLESWRPRIRLGGLVLDVGCADGRSCVPFAGSGSTIVGFDISKALVRQAIDRPAFRKAHASTMFFVGDASVLPFRDDTFDHVIIYGVLHHVPRPAETCREAVRVLKPGGVYLGSENNVTVFRGIFDLLMKIRPIWKEEAGDQPLISRRHIEQWLAGLPAKIECRSSVFLPPQVVNLVGHGTAGSALRLSDRVFTAIPGMREQGGLIVFEVEKQPGRSSTGANRPA